MTEIDYVMLLLLLIITVWLAFDQFNKPPFKLP